MFNKLSIRGIALDSAGLVALADLKGVARRTALIGSASFIDILFLAPGIHCQQAAAEINGGEYPAACSLMTGDVFRIENQATVSFLQAVGESGHLTTVTVSPRDGKKETWLVAKLFRSERKASLLFFMGVALTVIITILLGRIRDWWALGVLGMLIGARVLNVKVIKRRVERGEHGFKGAREPDDLDGKILVVLGNDRWVRMEGKLNDIKAVTAGLWLAEPQTEETFAVSTATLLVYCSAALAGNASTVGSLLLACLLLISGGILGLSNASTTTLQMYDRVLTNVPQSTKRYGRRREMVVDMKKEHKTEHWAHNMDLIPRVTEDTFESECQF